MLRMGTFQYFQSIYDAIMQSIADIYFIQGVHIDLIDNFHDDGKKIT